jgi:hypothetical protein
MQQPQANLASNYNDHGALTSWYSVQPANDNTGDSMHQARIVKTTTTTTNPLMASLFPSDAH